MSTLSQRNFAAGEITPEIFSRIDTVKYATGLKTCRNTFIKKQGGAANRSGTKLISEVADSTKKVRLIPFVFSNEQTYVLEFGHQYIRVFRDGQWLSVQADIYGITKANPAVVNTGGDFRTGDIVSISGVGGMTQVNGNTYKVGTKGVGTFQLKNLDGSNVNSTSYGTYTSGGLVSGHLNITTTYTETELPEIRFVQSADVITLAHPSHPLRNLSRESDLEWILSVVDFDPEISKPFNVLVSKGAVGSNSYLYGVTAISELGEESYMSAYGTTSSAAVPTVAAPNVITWDQLYPAKEFFIYRWVNQVPSFLGIARGQSFSDIGLTPDVFDNPPSDMDTMFTLAGYPGAVTYFQQRLLLGNFVNMPETVKASQTGFFRGFSTHLTSDDAAISFTLAGRQINRILHLVDLGRLILFTQTGEWVVDADVLTPSTISLKQISYNGSNHLAPIVINNMALYVQARGGIVRDLNFLQGDAQGSDLTIFSSHLFEGNTLTDWCYQQVPDSIVWAVRSDGVLLGMTFLREQEIIAWHRHDTDGVIENVCCVPEGNEDALYIVVRRTVDGATKRYIERLNSRYVEDERDYNFTDCSLTFDGRNTNASHTMTLSGGTAWENGEGLTLTSSTSYFAVDDVGNDIQFTDPDGEILRLRILSRTSGTAAIVTPERTVPVSLRNSATNVWAKAVDEISGLGHLEGKAVSVYADAVVVANPNNPDYDILTVDGGEIILSEPAAVIHVGLPYTSDVETLDVDTADGETMATQAKSISKVIVRVKDTRGLWLANEKPEDDMISPNEMSEAGIEETYTGVKLVTVPTGWNEHGRVFIRQSDPLPMTVLSISPQGLFSTGRRGYGR